MSHTHRTIKHDIIRAWADAHGGVPAIVKGTQDALKIKFGRDEAQYEPIEWKKWEEIFDQESFAFVYEEPGYLCKIVRRNGREDGAS